MDPEERKNINTKLTYSAESWKISYSFFWDNSWNKYYNHSYRLAPDGLKDHYKTNTVNNLQFAYYPTQDLYISLKFSTNLNKYWGELYADPYDPRYVVPATSDPRGSYTFRYGGNETDRYFRYTKSDLILFSTEYQLNKEHKLKFGADAKFHKLYNSSKDIFWKDIYDSTGANVIGYEKTYTNLGTASNQLYIKFPYEFAFYLQDKMEYDMMIINAGVRFDYFSSNTWVPVDIRNPRQGEGANEDFPGADQRRDAVSEYQVSPRLGVSFPISDEGAIHFSYGHFFQIPSFENLYSNSHYIIETSSLSSVLGNPELKSMKTVKYEIGLQQVLFPNISADISLYYSDIRNLLGVQILSTYESDRFGRYINRDYGNSKGLIVTIEKRHSDYFSAKLDYTYQVAQGNGSDPLMLFYNSQSDPPKEEVKILSPLDWDQGSTLNLSVTFGDFTDWTVGLIFTYGAGFPYSIDPSYSNAIQRINNGRKPTTNNLDLKATKIFDVFGFDLNAYLIVYNVFDTKNEYNVSSNTGRAGYDLAAQKYNSYIYGLNTIEEYTKNPGDYSRPREVRLGFGIGF
jgi:outer membrane receptor protein involved in Fe transport